MDSNVRKQPDCKEVQEMPQLSLYMTEDEMDSLRKDAGDAGMSISSFARSILGKRECGNGWPDGYFELYGSCPDIDIEEQDEIPWELDCPRSAL